MKSSHPPRERAGSQGPALGGPGVGQAGRRRGEVSAAGAGEGTRTPLHALLGDSSGALCRQ